MFIQMLLMEDIGINSIKIVFYMWSPSENNEFEIEFYFCPDQLGIDDVQYIELQSSKYLMVRSNKELDFKGYKFPVLAEF